MLYISGLDRFRSLLGIGALTQIPESLPTDEEVAAIKKVWPDYRKTILTLTKGEVSCPYSLDSTFKKITNLKNDFMVSWILFYKIVHGS